jgi:type II secretory pathway component PulM
MRDKINSLVSQISNWLSGLTERERRLVMATAAVATLFVVGGGILWVSDSIASKEKRIQLRQEQLDQILTLEGAYFEAKEKLNAEERRLKGNKVTLFSLCNKAANEIGLTLNDLNERKRPVKGTNLEEVSVEVNLKSMTMDKLTSFLEAIEGKRAGGLVKITKLKVKSRFDQPDLLDVQMTVATWKVAS